MKDKDIEMTGWVAAKKEVRTLKDLRDLVAWADTYKVKDESAVDLEPRGFVYLDFIGDSEVASATWIECGDHLYGDEQFDILIETHRHEPSAANQTVILNDYSCDCELCLSDPFAGRSDNYAEPARFDWPARDRLDRYGDESRPE